MARPSSDIDPRRTDALRQPKRRRKDRKLPDPPECLKAGEYAAIEQLKALPITPGVLSELKGDSWVAGPPHNDRPLWEVQLASAFGTRSTSLMQSFMRQLRKLCPQDWDDGVQAWKVNETEWNALLALVADHQPENATQAALAAQMASVHLMQIRLAEQALNRGGMVMEKDAALASKLARTYTMQCETMQALKGKKKTTRQSIKVAKETHHHQHIHVHREGKENEREPHERAEGQRAQIIDQRSPLRSEDESGRVVPLPRNQGSR